MSQCAGLYYKRLPTSQLVALVLQMFRRAGRISAGETEGWAFLIADENERPAWQARLIAGYNVTSRITESLPDHVLAEAVQGRPPAGSPATRTFNEPFRASD
jgi:helicase